MLFTLTLIAAIFGLVYLFLNWNYSYWKKRGVPGPKPELLVGNYPSLFNRKFHVTHDLDQIYQAYKKTTDYVGIYNSRTPQLLVVNPALARRVFVSDFKHFHDNEISKMVDEKSDFIFANNPFALTGEKWKQRRAEVTPGLTTSRIKSVYPVTKKVVKHLCDFIEKEIKMGNKDGTNAKDLCLRFTSDVVTDCVLGINAGSFELNPMPIMSIINELFDQSLGRTLYLILVGLLPALHGLFKLRFLSKRGQDYFYDLMDKAIALRKSQGNAQAERVDFMNYLLELQRKKNLNNKELTAYTMTFMLDGFETIAVAITNCLLLLGRHPDVQEKLSQEILANLDKSGDIDFDKLSELQYLDACIHEAIRMIPPGFLAIKLCTAPIMLTNKDGTSVQLHKNDPIILPLFSLMNDEDIYENPSEFRPERFLEQPDGVKFYRDKGLYFGFGDGPRICLGMRFALTQMKAALVEIFKNYVVKINPKTQSDNRIDPKYFILQLDGGVWLDFERRN